MEQTYYMIRTKDKTKYLVKHISRYGSSINLSKDKDDIIEADTLDTARRYLRNYLAQTATVNPTDLEIIKAKKIITIEEEETYPAIPNSVVICTSGFGYTLSTQEEYERYHNCLGPTLKTAETKLTRDLIGDWVTKYFNRRVENSFEYKLKKNALYDRYIDIEVTNISFR